MVSVKCFKYLCIWPLLLVCLVIALVPDSAADPIIKSWQVGSPIGRATFLIGNNADVRSGVYYDINYTIGFHKHFSLELKAGTFSSPYFMRRVDDTAREDELWKVGVTFVGISPVVNVYSSEKTRLYGSLTAGYSNIQVTLPQKYSQFFSERRLPRTRDEMDAHRIDSLALAGAIGYERKLNEILRFYCEGGYYADSFDVFVTWGDDESGEGSAHTRELSMDSYTFGFGLKACFNIN